jgi:hypothetical protein
MGIAELPGTQWSVPWRSASVLAGARSLAAIGEWAADAAGQVLATLGCLDCSAGLERAERHQPNVMLGTGYSLYEQGGECHDRAVQAVPRKDRMEWGQWLTAHTELTRRPDASSAPPAGTRPSSPSQLW